MGGGEDDVAGAGEAAMALVAQLIVPNESVRDRWA